MATQPATDHRTSHRYYERFTVAQRIEHFVLILTFTTLAVTGLPQKFVGNAFAEGLIAAMGGIETVRIIHRVAAIAIVLQSMYHALVLGYKVWVRRTEMTMLPGLKDMTDAVDVVRYNLSLTKEHPRMPRYNFGEKVEYWAMVWGTVIMAITGFMLWNPIAASRFLPGQVIPAAKAAHGAEAILAVLAILIWHFYNVHVKSFNRSIFTGKMTQHQMEEEHGEELHQRVAGLARPAPNPEGVHRRERIYVPLAVVLSLMFAFGLYWFATFEETAIATIPLPATQVPAFSPLTPSPVPTSQPQLVAAQIPHPIKGQEQCETCHGPSGMRPYPVDHVGRPNESCTICHLPGPTPEPGAAAAAGGATPGGPRPMPANHDLAVDAYKDCSVCHGLDKIKPFPPNHTTFPQDGCTSCHRPAEEGTIEGATAGNATPEPQADTATPEAPASGPRPIPVSHDLTNPAYENCATCHGPAGIRPYPPNHESFPQDNCVACHKPAEEGASGDATPGASSTSEVVTPEASTTEAPASGPRPIPVSHDLTNPAYENCATCHGPAGIRPYPPNHESFPQDNCVACHKPAE